MSPLHAWMRQLRGLEHSSCSNLQVSMPATVASASLDLKAEAFQAVAHGELWLRRLMGCEKRGKKQAEGSLILLVSYTLLLLGRISQKYLIQGCSWLSVQAAPGHRTQPSRQWQKQPFSFLQSRAGGTRWQWFQADKLMVHTWEVVRAAGKISHKENWRECLG